jgi:hypothetical protein
MKKTLLLIFSTLTIGSVSAQYVEKGVSDDEMLSRFEGMKADFVENNGEWVFTKIVEVPDKAKDDIYSAVIEVLASVYHDSKEVIQSQDKEAGTIIAKGFVDSDFRTISWVSITRNRCWQIIKLDIRDNRFRMTLAVNSVMTEVGADLRHPFNGAENSLISYFPYNEDWKSKDRWWSFNNLVFAHDCSLSMLDTLASEINSKLSDNGDW